MAARKSEPFFTSLPNLASKELGSRILFATDEWFAAAENLLNPNLPIFIRDKFTEYGKWMDGWETRRKRSAGYDWCIIQLGLAGTIRGIDIDTLHFTGNYAPKVSIQAASVSFDLENCLKKLPGDICRNVGKIGTGATLEEIQLILDYMNQHVTWVDVIKHESLNAGYFDVSHNYFKINTKGKVFSHLKFSIHPDGGVARLRVYGDVHLSSDVLQRIGGETIDLCSCMNGGLALLWSDCHFSHPKNLLLPTKAENMGSGWETARSKNRPAEIIVDDSGRVINFESSDWVIIKLGVFGYIECVEVDTTHFIGNYPESFTLEVCNCPEIFEEDPLTQKIYFDENKNSVIWSKIITLAPLKPHTTQFFATSQQHSKYKMSLPILEAHKEVSHVRFTIIPDGGISRLRLWGQISSRQKKESSR